MKFLIVGLGNIGSEYDGTRHNIGFDIADVLTMKYEGKFAPDRLADMAQFKYKGRTIVVIKPTTYMNLSGKAVKYWMDKEKTPIENVLVLVDEIALPLGTVRMKGSGSDGGHNGLKSIQDVLQTAKYPRLRFGVGNDFPKGRQVEHVLGKWNADEMPILKEKIPKAVEMIESFVFQGIQRTMNNYNE
ncbi:MAG: aminoacyl-tRNA hydrolase [Chitinophagales bacterium]|nr:aminoacyl-tRNA hydrolase [Chitinophagaceae bacterium]MCB9066105.1 aminoacyl-tRNA hydrolase [Chitinophagales bacterium]